MTDENKQNENKPTYAEQSNTGQAKAKTLFSVLSEKFEPLAKLPETKLPAWYGLAFLAIIVVIFAWKQIAVGKVEADMNKQLESERVLITQQAREYADEQYVQEEVRFGQVLSWAVRGELIRNNLDQVEQFLNEIVKMKDTERVDLIDNDGQLIISTDKRHEEAEAGDLFSDAILQERKITVHSDIDGKKLLTVPVMGLNDRLAIIVISYNIPAL